MQKRQGGLTLLELLVGVAIVSILLSIAVPSFQVMRNQNTVRSAGMAIYADLQLARSEAIKHNQDVTVCFSGTESVNWSYVIRRSTDCSGAEIAKTQAAHYPNILIKFPDSDGDDKYELTFKPRRQNLGSGTLIVSDGDASIRIITASSGRIRTCTDDYLTGVPAC